MSTIPGQKPKSVRTASDIKGPFPDLYLKLLRKENRLYDDAEVKELPGTFFYNLHRQEWSVREKSVARLLKYLDRETNEGEKFRLLDVGTGTGWMAAQVAGLEQWDVIGVDIVDTLLQQAARVFPLPNLDFVLGDIFQEIFPRESFDVVLLFDSIQYFPNISQLLERCKEYLKEGGEIHILESPLLLDKEQETAAQSAKAHYEQLGIPRMADHHFFHTKSDIQPFDHQYLYRPGGLGGLFGRKDSEHPWLKMVK